MERINHLEALTFLMCAFCVTVLAEPGEPEFAAKPLFASGLARVAGLESGPEFDVMLLDSGLDQGFRAGVLCEVFDSRGVIGEAMILETRIERSVAALLSLKGDRGVDEGDFIRIKTQSF